MRWNSVNFLYFYSTGCEIASHDLRIWSLASLIWSGDQTHGAEERTRESIEGQQVQLIDDEGVRVRSQRMNLFDRQFIEFMYRSETMR